MSEQTKLEACPFCGEQPRLADSAFHGGYATCSSPHPNGPWHPAITMPLHYWNLRAERPGWPTPSPTGTELALNEAKQHIATLTKFWMENAGWTEAATKALEFINGIPALHPSVAEGRRGEKI